MSTDTKIRLLWWVCLLNSIGILALSVAVIGRH
jgi:hypothetical protein